MTDGSLTRKRFPAVSIEAAVRFGTNEIRVGSPAPDFELPDLQGCLSRQAARDFARLLKEEGKRR